LPTSADLLLDTSAAIALLSPTADGHDAVLERTRGLTLGLAGHAAFETYSVLTRLPGALRLSAETARTAIETNFPAGAYLSPEQATDALARLSAAGTVGGSVYDGLVGLAAAEAGVPLLSRDRRAQRTYAAIAVAAIMV